MDLSEVHRTLREIYKERWIPTLRRGATGVGFTLEQRLGLTENNLEISDLGQVELKARRRNTHSMLTLFTLDRGAWQVSQRDLVRTYGTPSEDGRTNLYHTVSCLRNSSPFILTTTQDAVTLNSSGVTQLANWSLSEVSRRFNDKIRHTLLITAESKTEANTEWFWYRRAELFTSTVTPTILRHLFSEGVLCIDVRMHLKRSGTVRNHGTAFRIPEVRFGDLFGRRVVIDLEEEEPLDIWQAL